MWSLSNIKPKSEELHSVWPTSISISHNVSVCPEHTLHAHGYVRSLCVQAAGHVLTQPLRTPSLPCPGHLSVLRLPCQNKEETLRNLAASPGSAASLLCGLRPVQLPLCTLFLLACKGDDQTQPRRVAVRMRRGRWKCVLARGGLGALPSSWHGGHNSRTMRRVFMVTNSARWRAFGY